MNDTELDQLLNAWEAPGAPVSLRTRLLAAAPQRRARRIFGVRPWWIAAFAAGAGALALAASLAGDGMVASDAGRWDSHTYMRRTRFVQPAIARLTFWHLMSGRSTGWQWQDGKLVGSAYVFNRWSHAHYGYTFHAEPLGAGQYRFTVLPLDPSVVKEGGPIVPARQLPGPRIVTAGSRFEVDLETSGHERVYDRFELSGEPVGGAIPPELQTPVTVILTKPRLFINGRLAMDSGGVAEARGLSVNVDVPGRGRYVLALDAQGNARFFAGRIRGNAIEFESAGDRFRIECSAPIAAGGDRPIFVFWQKDAEVSRPEFWSGGPPPSRYR